MNRTLIDHVLTFNQRGSFFSFGRQNYIKGILWINTYLILAFENEDVGNAAEWYAKMDDFTFRYLIRYISDMNDFRRFAVVTLVELNL